MAALKQSHENAFREYQTIMALGTQLLKEEKREAYREVERYAYGKSCSLEGISAAASALGIKWEELTCSENSEGEENE